MDLEKHAREHIESMVADLEEDEDFMPFLLYEGTAKGKPAHGYCALEMPDGQDGHDRAGAFMFATCAMFQATQALFASVSWMVNVPEGQSLPGVPPSEHPDRVEAVFMAYAGPEANTFHTAPVIREGGTVKLGDWTVTDGVEAGGRFGEAIHLGMSFGQGMPPEMLEYIAVNIDDDPESILRPMSRAYYRMVKA